MNYINKLSMMKGLEEERFLIIEKNKVSFSMGGKEIKELWLCDHEIYNKDGTLLETKQQYLAIPQETLDALKEGKQGIWAVLEKEQIEQTWKLKPNAMEKLKEASKHIKVIGWGKEKEEKLLAKLDKSRSEIKKGRGKILRSLKDLR